MKNKLGEIFIKCESPNMSEAFTYQSYKQMYDKATYLSHDFSGKDTFSCLLSLLLSRYRGTFFNLKKYNITF